MRYLKVIIGIVVIIIISFLINYSYSSNNLTDNDVIQGDAVIDNSNVVLDSTEESQIDLASYNSPLDRPNERINKKPFGIHITTQNSPIQPERFAGYHTGSDFEIFDDELDQVVEVVSFCTGDLLLKKTASGYGGVVVQKCELEERPVTIIYGHLKFASVTTNVGSSVNRGDVIGILGANNSAETDGERKHLHFAIHKGNEIDLKGYVQNELELANWIDPKTYFK